MRKNNANAERQSAGVVSDGGRDEGGAFKIESSIGEGSDAGRDGGGELFTRLGGDFRGADAGDGVPETPKRRGRKPGSKNAAKSATPGGLAAARAKLADSLSGLVGFGVSFYGTTRANKYKRTNPQLAYEVYCCYQIPPEAAKGVGQPLADTFCTWFPQYVEPAVKGIDPAVAIFRLSAIIQQAQENEKIVVEKRAMPVQTQTNGNRPENPPPDLTIPEGAKADPAVENTEVNEWMSQQPLTPADTVV